MIALIIICLIGGIAGWFTLPFMDAAPSLVFKKFDLNAKVANVNYSQAIHLFLVILSFIFLFWGSIFLVIDVIFQAQFQANRKYYAGFFLFFYFASFIGSFFYISRKKVR